MYKKKNIVILSMNIIVFCLVVWVITGCTACKSNMRQANSVPQDNNTPVAVIKVYDNTGHLVE
jgi:hypothetical protein